MSEAAMEHADAGATPAPPAPSEPGPGGQLRAARERLGMTLPDVARHLKLHPRQVEALERDDFSALPGPVFVRGFLRNYARLLALDGEALVALAERTGRLPAPQDQARATAVAQHRTAMPASLREPLEKRHSKKGWIPVTVALLAAVAGILYFHGQDTVQVPPARTTAEPASESQGAAPTTAELPATSAPPAATDTASMPAPALPSAEPVTPATSAPAPAGVPPQVAVGPAPPPAAPSPAAVPAPAIPAPLLQTTVAATRPPEEAPKPVAEKPAPPKPESRPVPKESAASVASPPPPPLDVATGRPASGPEIRLSFTRESWVEVRDSSGSVIFSQLNPPGTERVVRGQPPFQVTVGNASGVSVNYNSREIDLGPFTRTDVAHITLE